MKLHAHEILQFHDVCGFGLTKNPVFVGTYGGWFQLHEGRDVGGPHALRKISGDLNFPCRQIEHHRKAAEIRWLIHGLCPALMPDAPKKE